MKQKQNIFIGMQDVCSTIDEMYNVYSEMGHKVYTAVHEQNNVFDQSKVDFNLSEETKRYFSSTVFKLRYRLFKHDGIKHVKNKFIESIIEQNDIFIMYYPPINNDFSDLKAIKDAGKKIICLIFGDDVRWYNAMKQSHQKNGMPPMEYEEKYISSLAVNRSIGYLRNVEKYADVIVMHPDSAHMALRPYHHYYMQLDAAKFKPFGTQRKIKPVVAHAPSDKKVKGTEYVLKAVNELKEEGLDFEFRLMEKVPYNRVYDFYKDIDVMVVQLLAHGGGKQSYELLSCGKVVISRMQYDEYLSHIKEECPIVDADIHSIKNTLKEIILDHNKRVELAERGRDYVLKYHDVNAFCARILQALDHTNQWDYVPSFFRNEYQPDPKEIVDLNKWNEFVSGCKWYKEHVEPGQRAGLKF